MAPSPGKSYLEMKPTINPGVKPFSSLLMTRQNNLECLYLAITFQSSLTFAGNTGAFPRRKHLKGAPIGLALALPSNSKT
jgi:hypothetical protein